MKRYGIVYDYDVVFDLDPFPSIPSGSLRMEDMYLVNVGLGMMVEEGVKDIFVLSSVGSAYLSEAIGEYPGYPSLQAFYFSDMEDVGSGGLLRKTLENIQDFTEPVTMVPANILTDLSLAEVRKFHIDSQRPLATVVVVPGVNTSELKGIPAGYRPTNTMFIERGLAKVSKKKSSFSVRELLAMAEEKHEVHYYMFDGFYYEVDEAAKYLSLVHQ